MNVELIQEFAANGLPGTALEQHIVRNDDGGSAPDFEECFDVLEEVQLFVGRRGPEVVPLVGQRFLDCLSLGARHGDAAFLAKRGIC